MNLFMDNGILFVDAKSRINVCKGGDELNLVGMEIAKQNKTLRAIKQIITQKEYISFYTICYMNGTERYSQRIHFCCKVEPALMCLWICYESLI